MEIATLQAFCSTNEYYRHYGIDRPFTRGNWTYATDGVVCVRVPAIPDITHAIKDSMAEGAEKLFVATESRMSVWQPLPEFELTYSDCQKCKGHGWLNVCSRFNRLEYCAHREGRLCREYDEKCSKGGNKSTLTCENCGGRGTVKLPGRHIVQGSAGMTRISAIYLDMIKTLPNVMIAPYDETTAFLFKFDGGEGLLMPMGQQ